MGFFFWIPVEWNDVPPKFFFYYYSVRVFPLICDAIKIDFILLLVLKIFLLLD